jgi:hypothetical protein
LNPNHPGKKASDALNAAPGTLILARNLIEGTSFHSRRY